MNKKIPLYLMFICAIAWAHFGLPSFGAEEQTSSNDAFVIKGSKALSQIVTTLQREGYQPNSLLNPVVMEKALNECISKQAGICYYHGSPNKELTVLEPQSKTIRSAQEGALVFASPYPEVASCFLFDHDDSWTHQWVGHTFEQSVLTYSVSMVIGDPERFAKCDRGGSLYCLPPAKFFFNHGIGLGLNECTQKEPVKPLKRIDFPTALAAMQEYGVNVIFIGPKQFDHYKTLPWKQKIPYLKEINKI